MQLSQIPTHPKEFPEYLVHIYRTIIEPAIDSENFEGLEEVISDLDRKFKFKDDMSEWKWPNTIGSCISVLMHLRPILHYTEDYSRDEEAFEIHNDGIKKYIAQIERDIRPKTPNETE